MRPKRRDQREALSCSRSGFGAKAAAAADSHGRAIAFVLAPGQAHEAPLAPALLAKLPGNPLWLAADEGYASDAVRSQVRDIGARPAIPAKRGEAAVRCPDWIYKHRHEIERLGGRLKERRAVATRYEKRAGSLMGVLCLAATMKRPKL